MLIVLSSLACLGYGTRGNSVFSLFMLPTLWTPTLSTAPLIPFSGCPFLSLLASLGILCPPVFLFWLCCAGHAGS